MNLGNKTKEELIDIAKEALIKAGEMHKEAKYIRLFKPEIGEKYSYINEWLSISATENKNSDEDIARIEAHNCFPFGPANLKKVYKTAEKIEHVLLTEALSNELNRDWETDWENKEQSKFFIYYGHEDEAFESGCDTTCENKEITYFKDSTAINKAIGYLKNLKK